jgi:hypothetical protein
VAAPLAFCSRRRRALNCFWVGLAFFALSWCLKVPGMVQLLRLPGMKMMSHNRLVFLFSFAILCLSAEGLESLRQGAAKWHRWMWVPTALLAALCAWCVFRAVSLPEPIGTEISRLVAQGHRYDWVADAKGVLQVQTWFSAHYLWAAVWCALSLFCWLFLRRRQDTQTELLAVLSLLMAGDLLWFAHGRNVQSDHQYYFPPVPALEQLAKTSPTRIMGFGCLPACLSVIPGLRDVRGYDAVDPTRYVELLALTARPDSAADPFALTQRLAPLAGPTPDGDIRLPPILDMLGVEYVIFRGKPDEKSHSVFQSPDYFVLANRQALKRVYVPRHVEVVTDGVSQLKKMGSADFDPRELAYIEQPLNLPASCMGMAEILEETSTRIKIAARMDTPGLVVLADLWDAGWKAYLDAKPVEIMRANHALRGVLAPKGNWTLEYRYEPASFTWGLRLAGAAVAAMLGWIAVGTWMSRSKEPVGSSGYGVN